MDGALPRMAVLGESRGVGSWTRILRAASGRDTLAVLDQAVVSGTSFLTTVLVGRWCGAGELGVYALGFTLLVAWTCVQESLIALPYTIYRHRPPTRQGDGTDEGAAYAGSVLAHQGLLSALACLMLAATAVVLSSEAAVSGLGTVTWVLAVVTPFALFREFGRRFAFAHLRIGAALVLDLSVAVLQLAGLICLAASGELSAATAYAAVGLACALTGAVWLYRARASFVIRWSDVRPAMRQSWSLGKWLFASQLTLSVQAYFIHWLLAWVVGATATGVYAACMTVVLFANPLFLGISNSLAPKAAKAFSDGGGAELWRVVFQTTWLLGTAMAIFCAAVFLAGEHVLGLLYQGGQYAGHGHTVAILALAMLASALGMPASNGLAAMERPRLIFVSGLLPVGLSVLLVPFLVAEWGVIGAAYGFLAGNVAGSVGRWAAFAALVGNADASVGTAKSPRQSAPSDMKQVLQQFMPSCNDRDWTIEPLNEGAQAITLTVRARQQPVCQTYRELVVKLYKPYFRSFEAIRGQFESMARLHAKLDSSAVNGWTIRAPLPLYLCEHPLAIVMTLVPGKSLNSWLKTASPMSVQVLELLADTVIAAMEPYWSSASQLHGDFNFDNILCDPGTRTLSFVDAGVLENAFLCDGVIGHWCPASRDLAHLLFETEVGVKKTFGNPGARRRQRYLAERIVRAFLMRIGSAAEKQRLLDEIQACVRTDLESLRPSWTPRGLWRGFIRRLATHRIDELLARLRV